MPSPLPTACPRCHNPAETGFARIMSSVLWSQPPGELIGEPLTPMPWTIQEFPGFRCPHCKLLILDYSQFAEQKR
jgi:Domain of unknown function (DUF6487)